MTDPCLPIIDLTLSYLTEHNNARSPQNNQNPLSISNSVIEIIYENDVGTPIEASRTQFFSSPVRRRNNGSRRRSATTRRNSNEPIEITDSPQANTSLPNNQRKVAKTLSKKKQKCQQNDDFTDPVRDRSPLGGNFGVCPICLETFGEQPLVSTKCGHVYCQKCLTQALRSEKKCPTCRKALRGSTAYHPLFLN